MLSVNALLEDGKVTLLEEIPRIQRARVIVTVIEELPPEPVRNNQRTIDTPYDDLIGVISAREDGSTKHDHYLTK